MIKNIYLLCLVVLLGVQIQITQQTSLREADIVYAIDIGNLEEYESSFGFTYSKDKYFDPKSRISDYRGNTEVNSIPIRFADDLALYYTERHSDNSFRYKLPFNDQDDGSYVIIVKMCEVYFQEPNKRKTNIKIGKQVVLKEVDIVERVGPFAALDLFIEFELKDGAVYVGDQKIAGGLTKKGELVVEFEKTDYDLPKADGLLVIKGTLEDSPEREYNRLKEDYMERIKDEMRAKEMEHKKREETRKILQDEFDPNVDTNYHIGFIQGITLLLKEPIGIAIVVFLVLFFVCLKITEKSENIYMEKSEQEEVTQEKKDQ